MKKLETQVAVVAGGPAGLAAAVQAAENGTKVMVFEKASVVGGAANMGMGPLGIGTKYQKDQMVDMTVEKAFKMFMDYTHWRVDATLVKKYFENSADTITWLEDMGVEFAGAYKYFPKSEATWHIVKPESGEPGPRAAATMIKRMTERAIELGVEFYFETPVYKILKDEEGKICGILAKDAKGEEYEVSCKAVVVATGGAGDNPDMIKERTPYTFGKDMFNFAIPGLKGDGIKMAEGVGAASTEMTIEMALTLPNTISASPVISVVFMQPNLLVNKLGKRFFNEEEIQNVTFAGNAIATQKDRSGFSILDSSIVKGYARKGPDVVSFVHHPESVASFDEEITDQIANGNPELFKADTLEELAEMMGIDPETFVETVEEYNDMCESADTQFYKPRQFMKPMKKAPFYAANLRPGGYGTLGGIKINENAEVLDKEWNRIPGLYAAGTDTCTIYGDSYMFLLPGNTMGYCVNTGRFAGESAAEYVEDCE